MIEIPSLRPESRYGMPGADQLLFNRQYVVGYSYLLRQAAWAMEVIDPFNRRVEVKRDDSFRSDLRVPEFFRAELADYVNSDHDRGHLIASADKRSNRIRNSETFLLSNMTPQKPQFNQGVWRKLEQAVRDLSHLYIETYVTCGPLFDVGKPIEVIGRNSDDENDVVVPIPHAYFKSILAENARGKLRLWSFMLKNEASSADISSFLCKTVDIERQGGLVLWDRLHGEKADEFKQHEGRMWDVDKAREAALLAQQERALNRLN